MHILGYRVQTAVVVVAALGLVVAAVSSGTLIRRGMSRRQAVTVSALAWTVIVMLTVSLAPDAGREGVGTCSFEFSVQPPWRSDQRLLNALMYVPIGLLGVLAVDGRRSRATVAVSILVLAALLELIQQFTIFGRSCDVADVMDNWMGAALGASVGMGVALVERLVVRASGS